MKSVKFLIALVIFSNILTAQCVLKGKVTEGITNDPLAYCTIRLENNTLGTTTNIDGNYILKLKPGKYKIIASYMGYLSGERVIEVSNKEETQNFTLYPSDVRFPDIVILPGENPALDIIRKAIEQKKKRNAIIKTLEYETYTKAVVKTDQNLSVSGNQASISVGGEDSINKPMNIAGILETKTKGYFESPDKEKEFIVARKQTANFPAYANTLTAGAVLENFYDEKLDIFGKNIPSPIADNALDYYYYYITGKNTFAGHTVYEIYTAPDNEADPGFTGKIYIDESTFDLLKVNLELNRSANTGGLFDTLQVFQQFDYFSGKIPMPVDYRMNIKANVLGLLKFELDLNTILHDYKVNTSIDENIFNNVILSVNTDADKKDSVYWSNTQVIPGTDEEKTAYTRIDSIVNIPYTFWDRFSFIATSINLDDNFSISGPLGLYRFNSIEGHGLSFNVSGSRLLDYRLNSYADVSYGFSDKKMKYSFGAKYLLGEYRTSRLDFNAYNKLSVLFENSDNYSDFLSSVLSLLSKYEFRDYFYRKGFDFKAHTELFYVLNLNAGFKYFNDTPALTKTRVSIFAKKKQFKDNLIIQAAETKLLTAGFKLDSRNSIEDGLYRKKAGASSYITLTGDVEIGKPGFLKNDFAFNKYNAEVNATLLTFRSAEFRVKLQGSYTEGNMPYHFATSLPGNINGLSTDYSFRTLGVNEVIANKSAVAYLEYDFNDEIFKILRLPGLKDIELTLSTFFNAAYIRLDDSFVKNIPVGLAYKEYKNPIMEAGFKIGHVLFPFSLEFAWRLNHRTSDSKTNFRISLNTGIL